MRSPTAIGYYVMTLNTGNNAVASQLVNINGDSIANLLPASIVINGSNFSSYSPSGYDTATMFFGNCDKPSKTMSLGNGYFINPAYYSSIPFYGSISPNNQTLSSGMSFISSKIPKQITASSLGISFQGGDNLYKWSRTANAFTTYTYAFGSWSPSEPTFDLGEGFMINVGSSTTHTFNQSFDPWQ